MNALTLLPQADALTMSSREIADLTGKDHKNVLADIRKMLSELMKTSADFSADLPDAYGRPQAAYLLPKRETLILVSGYSVELRARIIDRWQQLETELSQRVPASLPDFTNPAAAARAWADQVEQREQLALANQQQAQALAQALALAAPKAEALDRISASDGHLTLTEVAKMFGKKISELTGAMHAKGWIYRLNGSWVGYDYHVKNGDVAYKEARYTDQNTGQECIKPYCHVTQKGLVKLSLMFGVELPRRAA